MRKLMKVLPVIFVVTLALTSVFAFNEGEVKNSLGNKSGITSVTNVAQNVWGTVVVIVQILAVAAVVFAGLRYMFASADQKADIKKSIGILAIGAVLVFAATTIIVFVVNAANSALKNQ